VRFQAVGLGSQDCVRTAQSESEKSIRRECSKKEFHNTLGMLLCGIRWSGGNPLPFLALSKDGGFNSGCPAKLLIRLDAEPTCIGRAGFQFGSPLPIAWTRKLLGKTVFELGISCPPFEM